jgi:hypothetical protein
MTATNKAEVVAANARAPTTPAAPKCKSHC